MSDRALLEAALASVRAAEAALLAGLAAHAAGERSDELLDLRALRERYRVGRDAVLGGVERGELVASRGPRARILVARNEIERWLRSRPCRPSGKRLAEVVDLADYDRQAEAELRGMAGGSR